MALITRRQFLRTGAAAAAVMITSGPFAFGQARPTPSASSRKKIIIIGAGLAGLVSAYQLMKKGHDVVIFEAQERPGGRVQTIRRAFSDGLFTEVGAYYIPKSHRLLSYYLNQEFKLKLAPLLPDKEAGQEVPLPYYMEGHHILVKNSGQELVDAQDPEIDRWPAVRDEEKIRGGLYGLRSRYTSLKEWGEECDPLADLQEARWNPTRPGWPPPELKEYDDMTFAQFLTNKKQASPAAQALLKPWIAPFWDSFDNLSALSVLRETAIGRSFWDRTETFWTVDAGMESLPLAFAEALKERIRYRCPVIGFDFDGKSAAVTYWESGQGKGGGQTNEERADHIICAVPFSVLKNMKGISSFYIQKQKAIHKLDYTNVARVYLQCQDRSVWKDETTPRTPWKGVVFTDLPVMDLIDTSFHQPQKSGILHAAMSGAQARLITLMKEKDRVDYVVEEVSKVYPKIRESFQAAGEHAFTKCWDSTDEWTAGAYPIFRKGDVCSLTPHLASQEAVVHFAGDHTSSRPGWMEGALESGHRAAHEIDENVPLPYDEEPRCPEPTRR